MCRSVPQIEAAFTRTSTSVGPIAGIATVSICKPFAGCIFRNAFIVAAIYTGPRSTHKPSMLAHCAIDLHFAGRVQFTLSFEVSAPPLHESACTSSFPSFILPPFVHTHHPPRRRILFVQLRRSRNQPLHSRPPHITQIPQPYVTHALRLALQ